MCRWNSERKHKTPTPDFQGIGNIGNGPDAKIQLGDKLVNQALAIACGSLPATAADVNPERSRSAADTSRSQAPFGVWLFLLLVVRGRSEPSPSSHQLFMKNPGESGALGRTRTDNMQLRRLALYPVELQARILGSTVTLSGTLRLASRAPAGLLFSLLILVAVATAAVW